MTYVFAQPIKIRESLFLFDNHLNVLGLGSRSVFTFSRSYESHYSYICTHFEAVLIEAKDVIRISYGQLLRDCR